MILSDSAINKELYSKLSYDKIKINWNKNPIKMDMFLSFLTVEVVKSTDNLGICNGWTEYENKSINLIISGGFVREKQCEYLNSIRFGIKLQNPYNNWCNPFYIFDILTKEGQRFFVEYYRNDIVELMSKLDSSIAFKEKELHKMYDNKNIIDQEFNKLLKI
jgi:hypothetical protein